MNSPKATKAKAVLRIVPALTARAQLGQILKRVRRNKERFVVDRRGDPQAVIMRVKEYLRNFTRPIPVLEEIRQSVRAKGLDGVTLRAINKEIKRYRREHGKKHD
jgi:prevent-host-death family protein